VRLATPPRGPTTVVRRATPPRRMTTFVMSDEWATAADGNAAGANGAADVYGDVPQIAASMKAAVTTISFDRLFMIFSLGDEHCFWTSAILPPQRCVGETEQICSAKCGPLESW
jgi:hypothetical protein